MTAPQVTKDAVHTPRGRELAWLIAGFTLWFVVLCATYGLHAWGCKAGWSSGALIGMLAMLVVATLAVLLTGWWRWRAASLAVAPARWLPRAIVGGMVGAAVATLFSLGVPLLLTPCI